MKLKRKISTRIVIIVIPILLVCGLAVPKIFRLGTSKSVSKDYGELETIKKGVSISSSAKGNVSDEEIDDFIDEYGTDSNIIIYDVER